MSAVKRRAPRPAKVIGPRDSPINCCVKCGSEDSTLWLIRGDYQCISKADCLFRRERKRKR